MFVAAAVAARWDRTDAGSREHHKPAHAGQGVGGCIDSETLWIRHAAEDTGVRIAALRCTPRLVLRLSPEGSPPLDVEISRGAVQAFQRAGSLDVSPVLEVDDFRTLPLPEREAFEKLLAWLREHEAELDRQTRVPVVEHVVERRPTAALIALLAAVALGVMGSVRSRIRRADVLVGAAFAALSLTLRLAFGPWGPFHVNGQGPLWILGAATSPTELQAYGSGYPAILGSVAHLFRAAPDTSIFAANALFAALFSPAAFALCRGLGMNRGPAAAVALIAAADPVGVRFSATESYFPLLVLLDTLAQVALVQAATSWVEADRGRAMVFWAAAAGLAGAGAQVHPLALVPLALAPLITLALPGNATARTRLSLFGVSTLVTGAGAILGLFLGGTDLAAALHGDVANEALRPFAVGVAGIAFLGGCTMACAFPRGVRWLAPSAAAHVLAAKATMSAFTQSTLWLHAYLHLYAVVPMAFVAAALLPDFSRVRTRLGVAGGLAFSVALVIACVACPVVRQRTTQHDEYLWLREELRHVPPECRVAFVRSAGDVVMSIPLYDSKRWIRLTDESTEEDLATLRSPACTYYLHTSLCETAGGRAVCGRLERLLPLETQSQATFAAKPDCQVSYAGPEVHDTLFRVSGPSAAPKSGVELLAPQ
jgi:hypothetical protein